MTPDAKLRARLLKDIAHWTDEGVNLGAIVDLVLAQRAEAAKEERARVVAWFRTQFTNAFALSYAGLIEHGAHDTKEGGSDGG